MHANNDPLGVRSAYRFAGLTGGKAFGICQSPNQLFSFGRGTIVRASSRRCPEVIIVLRTKSPSVARRSQKLQLQTVKFPPAMSGWSSP